MAVQLTVVVAGKIASVGCVQIASGVRAATQNTDLQTTFFQRIRKSPQTLWKRTGTIA
jgi:hypothetical protein